MLVRFVSVGGQGVSYWKLSFNSSAFAMYVSADRRFREDFNGDQI